MATGIHIAKCIMFASRYSTCLSVECKRGLPAFRRDDFADTSKLCLRSDALDVLERVVELFCSGVETGRIR